MLFPYNYKYRIQSQTAKNEQVSNLLRLQRVKKKELVTIAITGLAITLLSRDLLTLSRLSQL